MSNIQDVTSREQVEELAAVALREFGQIDVLVNNAGIMPQAFLSKNKVDEWDIINLSSVAGHNIYPGGTVYCGTNMR